MQRRILPSEVRGDDRDQTEHRTDQCWMFLHTRQISVFSPFSLNAKLVGRLYESLAPAEGEVRGCDSCAYLRLRVCACVFGFYMCMVTFHRSHSSSFLKKKKNLLWTKKTSPLVCSSRALCSEERSFCASPTISRHFTVAVAMQSPP